MANYLDGMEDGKHNSDKIEVTDELKSFTVTLTFDCVHAKTPLQAAKIVAKWLVEDNGEGNAYNMIYDVEDEDTNKKFTVDLDADDEDAVQPN